jgi:CobQ-like glutamine amidotransferase family enzyme
VIIEHLYPDAAYLYGDPYNVRILALSRPDATIIETKLGETPAFVTRDDVDLVYLGSMTEEAQRAIAAALVPVTARIEELVDAGRHFLFTGNALDLAGERVTNPDMGYEFAGLGLFPFVTTLRMFARIHDRMFTMVDDLPVVGYRSTFSHHALRGDQRAAAWEFGRVMQGQGLTVGFGEGARRAGFIATEIIGPLLITNPLLTKGLLQHIDGDETPLAFESALIAAYEARLAEFRDPHRWEGKEH